MFEFVRRHTKAMMILMFSMIIPAFVFVGVDGVRGVMNARGVEVAKVAGQTITQTEWDFSHRQEVDRIRASMPNVDAKLFDSEEARYATLERLVRERVLAEVAKSAHFTVSDQRLASELQQNPTIASLHKPDGTLDVARYQQLLASQGLTPESFEAQVRRDLSLRQVDAGILNTAFSPASLSDMALNAFFERREAQIARFNSEEFAAKISLTDAEIEAFYKANQSMFQVPESANIEYVVLDMDAVKNTLTVSEADVKTYYEQNAAQLSGKEERRASHILITVAKTASPSERQKAKVQALALLEQVRKAPDSFAEVARKQSQDTGSAAAGGDLDFFGRGAMVKPFEDAVFAMNKGDISNVVESDFGFHIIRLTDIKSPKLRSLDELRSNIESDIKAQQAQRKFAELADSFINGVYEQSDALAPIAARLKLEVKTASNLQRTSSPVQTGVLNNPKFLSAVFGADSLEKKRNTEVVEIAANQLVAARVLQYTPSKTQTLSEAKPEVTQRLRAIRSVEMAKNEGISKLAAWKAQSDLAIFPAPVIVSRESNQTLPGVLSDAVLQADASSLPSWIGVDLGSRGYAVVRVNKVFARNPVSEASSKQEKMQFTQWVANAENEAYFQLLKARLKVEMKVKQPIRMATAAKRDEESH